MISKIIRHYDNHMPHNQIARLAGMMKHYTLPEGLVNMPQADTPAVVAIILYLLKRESEMSRTKLEYCLLFLDSMNKEDDMNDRILDWSKDMKGGRPNLEMFLKCMVAKGIITAKGKRYMISKRGRDEIDLVVFPDKLKSWLNSISEDVRNATSTETGRIVRQWISEYIIT